MSTPLDRRTLLRGLLGGVAVSVALPPLEAMMNASGTAYASGEAFPTRFGLFYWGNGNLPARWVPRQNGSGDAWSLSDQLAPLAPIKQHLGVVTGLDLLVPNNSPHGAGLVAGLCGAQMLNPEDDGTFPRPSIDRFLAARIGGATRYRSLEYGNYGGDSHDGVHQVAPAEESPFALYERLFGAGFFEPGEEPIIDPRWALRRSVLDAVMDDTNRMMSRVGASDRIRLQQHLDGVRELELRLARLEEDPPDLASCVRPDEPVDPLVPIDGRPQLAERNRVMSALAAMACACDQTRVVSNWFSRPVTDVLFPNAPAGHHQLTHDEPGEQPSVHAIVLQIMASYKDMVEAFAAIPEGDGTLLDHSVILGTSEVSLGRTHSIEDMPLLYAGSANGRLHTDLHVRIPPGQSTSRFMLSVIRAVGLSEASWGAGDNLATESLSAIEA